MLSETYSLHPLLDKHILKIWEICTEEWRAPTNSMVPAADWTVWEWPQPQFLWAGVKNKDILETVIIY